MDGAKILEVVSIRLKNNPITERLKDWVNFFREDTSLLYT